MVDREDLDAVAGVAGIDGEAITPERVGTDERPVRASRMRYASVGNQPVRTTVFDDGGTVRVVSRDDTAVYAGPSPAAAIEAALDEGPGTHYVRDGLTVDRTVSLTNRAQGRTLAGDGINSPTLTLDGGVDEPMFVWDGSDAEASEYFLGLRDLTLRGNEAANDGPSHGFALRNAGDRGLRDGLMDRVFVRDFAGDGVSLGNGWGWRFRDVVSEFNRGRGFHLHSYGKSVRMSRCKAITNGTRDFHCELDFLSMFGCEFGGAEYGVLLRDVDGASLYGCTTDGSSAVAGLRCEGVTRTGIYGGEIIAPSFDDDCEALRFEPNAWQQGDGYPPAGVAFFGFGRESTGAERPRARWPPGTVVVHAPASPSGG